MPTIVDVPNAAYPIYQLDPGSKSSLRSYISNLEHYEKDFQKMVEGSAFVPSLEETRRIGAEFQSLRLLKEDWDSYGAPPPNDRSYSLAEQAVGAARSLSMTGFRIVASAEGGIGLCFVNDDRYAHIEASNEGELISVMFSRDTKTRVIEIQGNDQLLRELEAIRDFVR